MSALQRSSWQTFTLLKDLINAENFAKWMEIIRRMLIREIPSQVDELDDCDKNETPFWKNKKWCCHITSRIFERYGSPGNVDEQYQGEHHLFLSKII